MADIPLKSFTFPGLPDKYTTPVVDNTLAVAGAAADAKKTGDEIAELKNDFQQFPSGNYPNMGAGYASQLVSGLKKEDSVPYNFRRIPYDATLEEVEKIVGGTIVNNQLVDTSTESVTVTSGHKIYKNIGGTATIAISDGTAISVTGGTDIVTDITQMLGTSIADYVYSLETATAGAGVAWLKKHFPKQFDAGYQAYDTGTLKSIEGLSGKKTVGFNQWNEVWENGTINGQGQDAIGTAVRPKGYIPVFPNTAYYIPPVMDGIFWYDADKNFISLNYSGGVKTSPNNAHFVRFYTQASYGQTYNHDICINLSDPTKNGQYEPYEAHSYALDSDVVLRGIPKLDANNNLYYDGDEYLPDGTVNRRYGLVDLGTLNWSRDATYGYFLNRYNVSPNEYIKTPALNTGYANLLCSKYTRNTAINIIYNSGSGIGCTNDGYLIIGDTNYTDPTTFKESLSGVYLLYELATPTTETADPYTTPQIITPDGTEEYIYEDGAFELPVGHSSDYPVNVSGQLDDILDTPSANGTYVLKATVADGAVTYSWVADA